eukprot:gb/GEZN01000874.1/.p1 GENE.gb/GEZN01000874.1/~~gb/GEZN01000874.1/.p1  ORF type:complete len:1167 (-),score=215.32 gb/GEZN01000874.1/:30-3530(-)
MAHAPPRKKQKQGTTEAESEEVESKVGFYLVTTSSPLTAAEEEKLHSVADLEVRAPTKKHAYIPRGISPFSSNAVEALGISKITRLELCWEADVPLAMDPLIWTEYPAKPRVLSEDKRTEVSEERLLEYGVAKELLPFYIDKFKTLTESELKDLVESNSEHSRHWFFNATINKGESLFDVIKKPLKALKGQSNSLIAFCDNSSAIKGFPTKVLIPRPQMYELTPVNYHITYTAETHNFPTGVCPFPGAATGVGGRIRDGDSTGRGSLVTASVAGYCVGRLDGKSKHELADPRAILVEGSNGASDYGNKFGEPIIGGFCRSFGLENREWIKPIMFSGGVGQMDDRHIKKYDVSPGLLVVKLGEKAFPIGIGGGSASSGQSTNTSAVQRGDPEAGQRAYRVIRRLVELGDQNPILSIHDQGAGGNANVLKEIVSPVGAKFDLDSIPTAEPMSSSELWVAEYQENNAFLIKDTEVLEQICKEERCPFSVVGKTEATGRVVVLHKGKKICDLSLKDALEELPVQSMSYTKPKPPARPAFKPSLDFTTALTKVLGLVSVGSKQFLTSKVDRSVTGLIAQQQCVGKNQVPVADVAVTAQSYFSHTGSAVGIGEQPIKTMLDPEAGARVSFAESLLNLCFADAKFDTIKFSGNWCWAKTEFPNEMICAAYAVSQALLETGLAIDGGKDSLFMRSKRTISPDSLIMSAYAAVDDIRRTITPVLQPVKGSVLYLLRAHGEQRLGGSALAYVHDSLGTISPDIEPKAAKAIYNQVRSMSGAEEVLAGHDVSDGGLITTLLEMAFGDGVGFTVQVEKEEPMRFFFNEEPAVVLQCPVALSSSRLAAVTAAGLQIQRLGQVDPDSSSAVLRVDGKEVLNMPLAALRADWERTSFDLDTSALRLEEQQHRLPPADFGWGGPDKMASLLERVVGDVRPRVAIVRDEGTNGDRELAAAFYEAGFTAVDLPVSTFAKAFKPEGFHGLAFAGGFSYSDVFGSAAGWAAALSPYKEKLDWFRQQPDKFVIGVCNGCQLLARLGWVGDNALLHNKSARFESRFTTVRVAPRTNSIFFQGLEDSVMGVWVAHGEGQFRSDKGKALSYVGPEGKATEQYPYNPNGSPTGTAAVSSEDGRVLAIMPHPERAFKLWQWPYLGKAAEVDEISPWLVFFNNAYKFVQQSKK